MYYPDRIDITYVCEGTKMLLFKIKSLQVLQKYYIHGDIYYGKKMFKLT